MQQTLLLLAYLYANPQTVLLLDEPDAHLEILRQRQIYQLLTQVADAQKLGVDPLFERYFDRLGLPDLLRKTDYHVLARLVSRDLIPPEVTARLDAIVTVAQRARPRL